MGRSRKRQHRLPSLIDTDMDRSDRSSHHSGDSSDSQSDSSHSTTHVDLLNVPTVPAMETVPAIGKRPRGKKVKDPAAPIPSSKVDYILTFFSAVEMKKPAGKREPKKSSLQLSSDEPWDTLKAQLLVKIDEVFKPTTLSIDDYDILFTIPRIVSKPGYPLASATDYSILLDRSVKSRLVQLSVSTAIDDGDKENEEMEKAEKAKKKKGRDPATLPGNVKKAANIRSIQERWRCAKKTAECQGTYCFVDNEGMHLPLSHERLDCWAAAMVRCNLFLFCFY
jgi:hypothetical protein